MNYLIGFLIWWALAGVAVCLFIPRPETKKQGVIQAICLGPIFWVGVTCYGIYWWWKK